LAGTRWAMIAAAVLVLSSLLRKRKDAQGKMDRIKTDWTMIVGFALLIGWLFVQSLWALAPDYHSELIEYWIKFLVILIFIPRVIDDESHLRIFLWTHVAGCFYLGWVVFTEHVGGRFEEFGASGISEANVGSHHLMTGVLVAGGLFLAGGVKQKLAVIAAAPFILNALVATQSRSGFLALVIGGLAFVMIAPKKFRGSIIALSAIAGIGFVSLTTGEFWNRMETIKYAGSDVENVDTGGGRLEIMSAQWQMFVGHPMGCGHRCTASLSAQYLDDRFLTGEEGERARSSHNTYMTLLVEQGAFGILAYLLMLLWIRKSVLKVLKDIGTGNVFLCCAAAGLGGALLAISIGDFFVSHTRLEVRFWLLGGLVALVKLAAIHAKSEASRTTQAAPTDNILSLRS